MKRVKLSKTSGLTRKEIQEKFGISHRTFFNYVHNGAIQPITHLTAPIYRIEV